MSQSVAASRRARAARAVERPPLDRLIIGLAGAGVGLVLLPLALSRLPGFRALASLQRMGWFLLLLGLALLALRQFTRASQPAPGFSSTRLPFAPSSQFRPSPPGRPNRPRRRRYEEVSANLVPHSTTQPPHSLLPDLSAAPPPIPTAPAAPAAPAAAPLPPQRLAPDAPPPRPTAWGPEVLRAIEWRRFEALVEALFAQAGFLTRSQSHGADGGVDIWLHSRHQPDGTPVSIVQCKHWSDRKPVGVDKIRELRGVMAAHGIRRGQFACTARYTDAARDFARDNQIHLLDGAALLDLIAKRLPEQQQALLDVALEGDYWKPTCVNCGVKMVFRVPRQEGKGFWGCANYPTCRATMNVRGWF